MDVEPDGKAYFADRCAVFTCAEAEVVAGPFWALTLADVVSNTEFLSFVETSIQTSFLMTVKVDGVAQDGTTMFIHNKVHNRTRTLTCAGVSVRMISDYSSCCPVTYVLS